MEIDRRGLVAGLAATAAAAMLPVLPVHGASFGAERFYYSVSFLFSLSTPWSDAAYAAHHARWHFDPNPKGCALIKHEGSGLTFRLAPQPDDPFVMEAVFIDGPLDGWPDVEEMAPSVERRYGLSSLGRIFATGSAARARFIFGAGIVIPAVIISRPMLKTRPRWREVHMALDRRELLTGLTAATVAALLPASPVLGSISARRWYLPKGLLFSLATPWSDAVNTAYHDSRWHFDHNPNGLPMLRHEASGLTFRRVRQFGYPFGAEAVFIDDPLEWPDAERIAAVGRAAVSTFVLGYNLRYWNRLNIPFYFRYKQPTSAKGYSVPSYVEDAPALA